jgi:Flp pilus assembly secretin CpaC
MPALMNLPILGALFKSRDYINRQTELMVLVTFMSCARGAKDREAG